MKKNCGIRLWARALLLCGLLGAGVVGANGQAAASGQPAVRSQLENARALEQRNRIDLAIPVWKRVLEADPKNTEALAGLARAAAQSGDGTLSTMYLDKLRAINPRDPRIALIEKIKPTPAAGKDKLAWQGPAEDRQHRVLSPEEAAYQALHAKRTAEAEAGFRAILKRQPNDASALAGMGYVRMQQENYTAAIGFLERAKQKRPRDQAVNDALETARFRFVLSEGDRALAAGDTATAEKRFRAALELQRRSPEALAGLGETLLARNDAAAAIPLFEQAIAAQPTTERAWRGLVFAVSAAGNEAAAVSADERMPEQVHTALHADPAYLQTLATAQMAVGRGGDAQGSLDTALRVASDDATRRRIQTQLAGVLLARNEPQRAAEMYRQLTAADASNIAAWQGLIEAEHVLGQNDAAMAASERMPAPVREQAVRQPGFAVALAEVYRTEKRFDMAQDLLQKAGAQPLRAGDRTHTAIEMELAAVDIDTGQPQLAYPLYQQVLREQPDRAEAWVGLLTALHLTGHDREAIEQAGLIPAGARAELERDPAYVETMRAAYAVTGRSDQGIQLAARPAATIELQSATAPADVAIENAWLLYTSGNDNALYQQLMALGERADLNEFERNSVQTIWADWSLRQAAKASDSGGTTHALAILNAASEEFAANAEVQRALAPGFLRAGDAQRADAIFKAQNMTSASTADYQAAIAAAMAAHDDRSADEWLGNALAKYPADPQILLLKGRYEQARGDTKRAQQYYEQSLKAMPPETRDNRAALPSGSAASGSGQLLAALLAPAGAEVAVGPILSSPLLPGFNGALVQNRLQAGGQAPVAPAASPTQTAAQAAGYAPFTPYIAPSRPMPAPNLTSANGRAEVPVQLGNNAAPPVQQPTEMTDVLPTARYVPNTRRPASLASDPNAAAAEAERVRRTQEAARRTQSRPEAEQAKTGAPLVTQPAVKPSETKNIPDTGTQQYPQPKTPPAVASRRSAPRPAPAPETAAAPTPVAAPIVAPVPVTTPPPPPPVFVAPVQPEVATQTVPPALMAAQAPMGALTPRQQAQQALAAIDASYSGFAGGMGSGRLRNGTAGLDRLVDIETPAEASVVFARTVRFTAVAQPVFLNSGVLAGTGVAPLTLPYLGRMPSSSMVVPAQQFSNGLGGELQAATRWFGVAAGYTPYQFLVHNVTGRVRLTPLGEHLVLFGERQPVKDTQLSYAGLRDPGVSATTGPIWGGVIATGGGVRLQGGSQGSVARVSAEAGVLTGRHVQSNTFLRGAVQGQFRVSGWSRGGMLALGGQIEGMHYQHDEYGLSYGQGGYFSPAYYFAGAVPVTIRGGGDSNFHYDVEASAGVRSFRQDAAAFFPLDAGLQGSFASCGSAAPSYACGCYPRMVSTGFEYALRGEFSYRLREHWYAGGFVRSTNRNNYQDVAAGFALRYTFRRQATAEGRPTGLFVTDGIRPLQIP